MLLRRLFHSSRHLRHGLQTLTTTTTATAASSSPLSAPFYFVASPPPSPPASSRRGSSTPPAATTTPISHGPSRRSRAQVRPRVSLAAHPPPSGSPPSARIPVCLLAEMRPAAAAASRAAFASVLLPPPSRALRARRASSPAATAYDHVSFVKEIAATDPLEHLDSLLNVLQARGEKLVSPGAKIGLIPLVVPLSESPAGNLTSLLRWPTAPRGMEMPVVEVCNHGLWLLAKNVNEYIHRILVEADISAESSDDLWSTAGEAGKSLYTKGDFKESQMADLDVYLLKKVGLYPDVIERKTSHHLEKGDNVSALITGEFYTREQFPGFGRPFVFNAEILRRVGRTFEARDSTRVVLKSPWWTLGCRYEEAAELAGWEDEQIEFIREKVTEEGKLEDLKKL